MGYGIYIDYGEDTSMDSYHGDVLNEIIMYYWTLDLTYIGS